MTFGELSSKIDYYLDLLEKKQNTFQIKMKILASAENLFIEIYSLRLRYNNIANWIEFKEDL